MKNLISKNCSSILPFFLIALIAIFAFCCARPVNAQSTWDCERYSDPFSFNVKQVNSSIWILSYSIKNDSIMTFNHAGVTSLELTSNDIILDSIEVVFVSKFPFSSTQIQASLKKVYFENSPQLVRQDVIFKTFPKWPDKKIETFYIYCKKEGNKVTFYDELVFTKTKSNWLWPTACVIVLIGFFLIDAIQKIGERRNYLKNESRVEKFFSGFFANTFCSFGEVIFILILIILFLFKIMSLVEDYSLDKIGIIFYLSLIFLFFLGKFILYKIFFRGIKKY
ncbi:MAG: hypothetical protein WC812_03905 [Candidatus Pacearchaeota archaeon]|jgi:hypothetical protein